ncbi:MAG: Hsp20 family protein [Rhodospirillales bacterium]|nr:Hsp20 family protein [Rhodospirillales bacterium]MCB9996107.1 Hsp20 family protein [Rhodospirillales bacterium]
MNTRLSLFDHPFFLGFDQFERDFDRIKKSAEGYPPYNVEQTSENGLRITLALAGFTLADLAVELENNQLTIRGRQQEESGRVYLHRGIAARQFQRSFVLADGIEIKGAVLDNGLLHIDMERKVPETGVRKIEICQSDTDSRKVMEVQNGQEGVKNDRA